MEVEKSEAAKLKAKLEALTQAHEELIKEKPELSVQCSEQSAPMQGKMWIRKMTEELLEQEKMWI